MTEEEKLDAGLYYDFWDILDHGDRGEKGSRGSRGKICLTKLSMKWYIDQNESEKSKSFVW